MSLSQQLPHMDSSGSGGGSRWFSCILISTCFCIFLALEDSRSETYSKLCQYKWSNQKVLAYTTSYASDFAQASVNHQVKSTHCHQYNLLYASTCDKNMSVYGVLQTQQHWMTVQFSSNRCNQCSWTRMEWKYTVPDAQNVKECVFQCEFQFDIKQW